MKGRKPRAVSLAALRRTALAILLVSLLLRLGHLDDAQPPTVAIVLAVAGSVVLLFGGWLGGHLVFGYGVSVDSERRPAAAPEPSMASVVEPEHARSV